ncbi:hypothetical protein PO909_003032 [Leuciscus waleckii]
MVNRPEPYRTVPYRTVLYCSVETSHKMVTRTKKIFVGGLSANTVVEDVKQYFEQFGKVLPTVFISAVGGSDGLKCHRDSFEKAACQFYPDVDEESTGLLVPLPREPNFTMRE